MGRIKGFGVAALLWLSAAGLAMAQGPGPVPTPGSGFPPSIGPVGQPMPLSADAIGWKNAGGNLTNVSATNPLPVAGTFSASIAGFTPTPSYTQLSVSGTTGNTALPTGTVVLVYNTGTNVAYVQLGGSGVTAATSNDAVPALGGCGFTVGSNGYLAAITASSTTSLNISGGSGLVSGCWGGGSGAGGGGGTVTQGPAAVSGPWITTPWMAGSVISATNGLFTNILQGNAVLSGSNGLFVAPVTGSVFQVQSNSLNMATAANQTNASQKTQIVDGSGNVIASTSNNLDVQCANCSGSGVSTADEASFTAGVSLFASSGGFYQTTATSNPLTTGQQGAFQVTANRALFTNLRSSAGVELATSSAPLFTSLNATPSLANGNGVVPTAGGVVLSATNGLYSNLLQGNAALSNSNPLFACLAIGGNGLSVTNGIYTNLLQGNAVLASGNPLFVQNTAGTAIMGKVGIDQTTLGATNGVSIADILGNAAVAGAGAVGTGTLRIAVGQDTTTVAGSATLPAGTNIVGKFGIDQTTVGTTNAISLAQVGATTVSSGAGAVGGGSQRVAVGQDSTTVAGLSPVSNATSGIATGANNAPTVAYNYALNGSGTWDQLKSSGGSLDVICTSGCSSTGGSSVLDNSAFSAGSTSITVAGGFVGSTAVTAASAGAFQMTTDRNLFVNVNKWAGSALGAMANYGTSPGAVLVPGVNASVTNTVAANLAQVNAVTTLTGAGASGTGAQRVTVSQDTGTIAGSAVGTAGTPSANVVSVQGISGGWAMPVSSATLATAANQEVTGAGSSATSAQGIQGVTGGVPVPISGGISGFATGGAVSGSNGVWVGGQSGGNWYGLQMDGASGPLIVDGSPTSGASFPQQPPISTLSTGTSTTTTLTAGNALGPTGSALITLTPFRQTAGGYAAYFTHASAHMLLSGAATPQLALLAWTRNPTNTTCTSGSAVTRSFTDDQYLVAGAPFPITLIPTTGGSTSVVDGTVPIGAVVKNNDTSPGNDLYVCPMIQTTIGTLSAAADWSISFYGQQF